MALESHTSKYINLDYTLTCPITDVPLSLPHSDLMPNETDKSILTKDLEENEYDNITHENIPRSNATVLDGGLLLQKIIIRHSKSTYDT